VRLSSDVWFELGLNSTNQSPIHDSDVAGGSKNDLLPVATQWHPAPKTVTCLERLVRKLLMSEWDRMGPNGTDRARTDDLLRVKQALFQLSYDPRRSIEFGPN
jgi:hypothetical protein